MEWMFILGLYRILAPARIRHFSQIAEIRLWQKFHRSRIVFPDLKSLFSPDIRYLRPVGLEYLIDFSLSKIK